MTKGPSNNGIDQRPWTASDAERKAADGMIDLTPEGIARLVAEGESETTEFKRRLLDDTTLARTLAAFANTRGGILLVGVDERTGITGLSPGEVEKQLERLKTIAATLLPYPVEVGALEVRGHTILYAIVDQAPEHVRPVMTASGQVYVRAQSTDRELPPRDVASSLDKPGARAIRAFVAMSFREEEEPALVDYFGAMLRAVGATRRPVELVRIDLKDGDYEISQEIMNGILKCDMVICDFTLSSRNVYFEVGYARGCGQRVIQTARQGTALEFDIRNWRTLFYKNATELEAKLGPELTKAYDAIVSAS